MVVVKKKNLCGGTSNNEWLEFDFSKIPLGHVGPDEPKARFENWQKMPVDLLSQLWGGNCTAPFPVGAFMEALQPCA